MTYQTPESVCQLLGRRAKLRCVAVLGGYQQCQRKIPTKIGGECNDRSPPACCPWLFAAFRAARFSRIVSAMVGGRFSSSLSPSGGIPNMCLSQQRGEIGKSSNRELTHSTMQGYLGSMCRRGLQVSQEGFEQKDNDQRDHLRCANHRARLYSDETGV